MDNIRENIKFAIYSRKSKFTGKGESIENQIGICKRFIKEQYGDVLEDDIFIYEDEGFSGKDMDRPEFIKMMKDGKEHKFNVVVCYRYDRISRDISDFSKMAKDLKRLGISFLSANEKFDTNTSTGRGMMMISSVFSQMERETLAERIRDNMNELAKAGRWLGGNTPIGYKSVEIVNSVTKNGKKRTACKLEQVEEEVGIVKLIFKKYMEYRSLAKLETYLLLNHYKTKMDKDFSRFSIKGILQNPVYMIADEDIWKFFKDNQIEIFSEKTDFDGIHGIMAYNKTVKTLSKANQIRKMNEWIISVGKHEGIVSGKEWIAVQELLKQNKSKSYRRQRSNVALLSGLLFCGNCGDYMRPKMSKRHNKDGEKIYDYLCETKEKSRREICNIKRPNGNMLDRIVCEEISKLSEDSSELFEQLEYIEKSISKQNDEHESHIKALKKNYNENQKKIDNLVMALLEADGTPAYNYINNQINELHEKNISIQNNIEEWENIIDDDGLTKYNFNILKKLLVSFSKSFDTMDIEQKREALKCFIQKVVWDGENVHIFFFGAESEQSKIKGGTPSQKGRVVNELLMMLRSDKKQSKEVYLYEPIGSDKEGNEINLLDIIESVDEDIADRLELKDNIGKLYGFVDKTLTPREKAIIGMRYGLTGEKEVTQREIADSMGISRSYVSRIEKKALKKLRDCYENEEKKGTRKKGT